MYQRTCKAPQSSHLSPVVPRSSIVSRAEPAGPSGAFAPGMEADARRGLFNRIAPVYDQLNDQLSFGQHHVWKRCAVKWTGAKKGDRCLDVCCGTGDLTFLLAEAAGANGEAIGLDFAEDILAYAALKQDRRPPIPPYKNQRITWTQGDAMALPFTDNSFDAATMGYGLRNVADVPKALRELRRVLRPGAKVAILDFNNTQDLLVASVQGVFLDNVVVPAARQYGLGPEYEYLKESIRRFPTGSEQVALARSAGFAKAVHYELMGGLMGCLVAQKGDN